jgi:hypothetical protein
MARRRGTGPTVLLMALLAAHARGEDAGPSSPVQETSPPPPESLSIFNHPSDTPWWISGQANSITQAHGDFPAAYSGTNSFSPKAEIATSRVLTLYTGYALGRRDEVLLDAEEAGGQGLSAALGIAGFPNLDVVRNPYLSKGVYLARLVVHHVFALSDETVEADRGPLGVLSTLPCRRIDVRVGKFSMVDYFDVNSIGSDTHLQFMNWAVDNNGAYDYAADTRGYTYGLIVEYHDGPWAVRLGEALMPTVANGIDLDWDVGKNRASNLEAEWRHGGAGRSGVVRALAYLNNANMGSYAEAIQDFRSGVGTVPDIVATREAGRTKYGFGLNAEQDLGVVGLFGRLGWNDGANESFAYTEVDNTVALGGSLKGDPWGRSHDQIGLAFVSNGISSVHQEYLALGGLGFILGDGGLRYGRETIVETYYTAHIWRGVFFGPDLQHVTNPGYNRDRGPALVVSFRLHLDF